jgi:hypothetical protein
VCLFEVHPPTITHVYFNLTRKRSSVSEILINNADNTLQGIPSRFSLHLEAFLDQKLLALFALRNLVSSRTHTHRWLYKIHALTKGLFRIPGRNRIVKRMISKTDIIYE